MRKIVRILLHHFPHLCASVGDGKRSIVRRRNKHTGLVTTTTAQRVCVCNQHTHTRKQGYRHLIFMNEFLFLSRCECDAEIAVVSEKQQQTTHHSVILFRVCVCKSVSQKAWPTPQVAKTNL